MAEQDPREFRGGAQGDNEGVVPREQLDDPGAPPSERDEGQSLSDASLGEVTDRSESGKVDIDSSQGDDADATSHSGTGANAEEVKEQMDEGEPVPWVQAANVAREDGNEDDTATA